MDDEITSLVAVILIFGLPIVFFIMYYLNKMKENKELTMLKSEIVHAGLDAGTIRELLKSEAGKKEQGKGRINFGTLRTAAVLIGLGVGAMCGYPFFGTAPSSRSGSCAAKCRIMPRPQPTRCKRARLTKKKHPNPDLTIISAGAASRFLRPLLTRCSPLFMSRRGTAILNGKA